ncbi:conserved hypothetical protein [uncultured Desulfobacterium sp.]|uniref:TssC1 N-terminal domain-containing protein n=1 Tax=uncultured Desulfobacterium sp. TaxID=201089 RepID=A0A445MTB9_9BACT|nr:conserved hypothetical protein [uncultured Desulfobacterium sp.]
MSKPISFGIFDFKIVASMDDTRTKPETETPFRICIMGDFSGRANRGVVDRLSTLKNLRPIEVDRDNIEDVMAKMGVEVRLSAAGKDNAPVTIRFTELDDMHPNNIFERVEVFKTLRDIRKRLNDPRTFESAKKEVQTWAGVRPTEPSSTISAQSGHKPVTPPGDSGSILDQIIGQTDGRPPDKDAVMKSSGWDAFLQQIVGPNLVSSDDPEQEKLVAAVDASISTLMQAILHNPDFQTVEAAWRALRFLVYRVETDERLKVYILDMSKAELEDDLNRTEDLSSTLAYKLFVEQAVGTLGGEPWAVLAGNYTFDQTLEDARILGRMARIASLAGAPFISAAHPHTLGCASLADIPDPTEWKISSDPEDARAWNAVRKLPESCYIGLALPRFLLRLPYGADTDPVDYFEFGEMPQPPIHENYLWGNPSFACALLLAQAFTNYGWDLRPGAILDIEGLPLHVYKYKGESEIKPCAEVLLTEKAVERILELGLMPLISYKNKDNIRLARFQSVADPLTQLAGPWDS